MYDPPSACTYVCRRGLVTGPMETCPSIVNTVRCVCPLWFYPKVLAVRRVAKGQEVSDTFPETQEAFNSISQGLNVVENQTSKLSLTLDAARWEHCVPETGT